MQSAGFKNNEVSLQSHRILNTVLILRLIFWLKLELNCAVEFAGQPIYSEFKLKRYITSRTTGPLHS